MLSNFKTKYVDEMKRRIRRIMSVINRYMEAGIICILFESCSNMLLPVASSDLEFFSSAIIKRQKQMRQSQTQNNIKLF